MGTDNQPPVEAIQGEARAREVIQADRDAASDLIEAINADLVWRDSFLLSAEAWRNGHRGKVQHIGIPQAFARHRVAFQSEARAVPSGGEREIIAAGREWIRSQVYSIESDGLCPADIDAGSADHSWRMAAFVAGARFRALPHQADREAIAREALTNARYALELWEREAIHGGNRLPWTERPIERGRQEIDRILALSPTPSAGRDGGGECIMCCVNQIPHNCTPTLTYRDGIETAARVADEFELQCQGGSGGSFKEARRNQSELIAAAIRKLP